MNISDKLGVNPITLKDKTLEDFEKICKGHIPKAEIKKKWDEVKKSFPKPKKVVKQKDEGAE